jgi:CHAT domain-containing protein/Tfp pilus assembly protein PilF
VRAAVGILVWVCAVPALVAAQVPSPEPQSSALELATRLADAADDDARDALLAAAPQAVRGHPLREALLQVARRRLDLGETPAAERACRLAEDDARRSGDQGDLAAALDVQVRLARGRGDYERSLELARSVESLQAALGDRAGLAVAHNGHAIALRYLGDYDGAMALYERARGIFEELGHTFGLQRVLNNIGVLLKNRGDLRRALESLERSLALTPEDDPTRSDQIVNIGLVHAQQGQHELAERYVRQALELDRRFRPVNVPWDLEVLFEFATEAGRLDEAEALYPQVLEGARRIGDAAQESNVESIRAAIALRRGRPQEALVFLERGRTLAEATGETPARMLADILTARAMNALGRAAEGEGPAKRALGLAAELHALDTVWWAHSTLGMLQAAQGRTQDASTSFESAIAALEEWRERSGGGAEEQHRFLDDKLEPYHALVDLLAASRPEEALRYAEQARARTLVDVLERGREDLDAHLGANERAEERGLERRLGALHAKRDAAAPAARSALEGPIREARDALASFRARMLAARPELQLARGTAPTASLADLQPLLDPRTACLVYAVTAGRVHLFVATLGASGAPVLEHHLVALSRRDLEERVEAFREHLARRDLGVELDARRLHHELVAPAAARLRGRTRVVVVPDGPLWSLPFAALQPRPGAYLLQQASVAYAPSLTAWRILSRARPRGTGLLALGNPDTSGTSLAPLPDAERQVRALGDLYGPRSAVFVGAQAGEARLRAEAARRGVLHIAAHGEIDDGNPLFSRLMLAKSGEDAARDGRLEAREILALDLSARLVVLAACETGRGRVRGGEGLIGLSWAFAVAGSPNVVASQWKVDSAGTTELMLGFHRRLLRARGGSADVGDALRGAALDLLRDPRYRHPFYWAGFFVLGSGRI